MELLERCGVASHPKAGDGRPVRRCTLPHGCRLEDVGSARVHRGLVTGIGRHRCAQKGWEKVVKGNFLVLSNVPFARLDREESGAAAVENLKKKKRV